MYFYMIAISLTKVCIKLNETDKQTQFSLSLIFNLLLLINPNPLGCVQNRNQILDVRVKDLHIFPKHFIIMMKILETTINYA